MHHNRLALYVHMVWATWDWTPRIHPEIERDIYRVIQHEMRALGCHTLAIGGTQDHLHQVLKFPATCCIADLVKQAKGVSSNMINTVRKPTEPFRWQGGYGAFTISRWDVEQIVAYVKYQKRHHNENTVTAEYEAIFEEDIAMLLPQQ